VEEFYLKQKIEMWLRVLLACVFCQLLLCFLSERVEGKTKFVVSNETLCGAAPWLINNRTHLDAVTKNKICPHSISYFANELNVVDMCVALDAKKMKDGASIIAILQQRGFLPTCRVMQLMLWMLSTASGGVLDHTMFVDVGSNIGSCSVNMAALGVKSIAVEPFKAHIDIINGSKTLNKHFHMHIIHAGAGEVSTQIVTNFIHGGRNYGSTMIVPETEKSSSSVSQQEDANQLISIVNLDDVLSSHHGSIPMLKLDCEGCEWEALLSMKESLDRVQMIKMEVNTPFAWTKYANTTAREMLSFLESRYDAPQYVVTSFMTRTLLLCLVSHQDCVE
jgi:FkbM family methyltransferase